MNRVRDTMYLMITLIIYTVIVTLGLCIDR